jgi:hypothetical protein
VQGWAAWGLGQAGWERLARCLGQVCSQQHSSTEMGVLPVVDAKAQGAHLKQPKQAIRRYLLLPCCWLPCTHCGAVPLCQKDLHAELACVWAAPPRCAQTSHAPVVQKHRRARGREAALPCCLPAAYAACIAQWRMLYPAACPHAAAQLIAEVWQPSREQACSLHSQRLHLVPIPPDASLWRGSGCGGCIMHTHLSSTRPHCFPTPAKRHSSQP